MYIKKNNGRHSPSWIFGGSSVHVMFLPKATEVYMSDVNSPYNHRGVPKTYKSRGSKKSTKRLLLVYYNTLSDILSVFIEGLHQLLLLSISLAIVHLTR